MEKNIGLLFSKEDLKKLLIPLLLEQLLSVSMGLADTLMVSGVGEAAVSSVSLVDSINVLVIQILSALATGGAVVTSQYIGHSDTVKARRSAAQLYTVLLLSTIAASVLAMIFRSSILQTVFGTVDADVMAFAQTYFLISAMSYPFMGIYNAGAALFRAQGNSKVSMRASLVMNVINVACNALLIYGFGMGVFGAAFATLLGRVVAALWITYRLQQKECPLHMESFADLRPNRDYIKRILAIGIPSGLENGMFQIGKLTVSHLTSTLGTAAIAANAVCNTVNTLTNIPGMAVGLSMIPVVGQCLGAGQRQQAKNNAKNLLKLAYGGVALLDIAMLFCAPWVARLFGLSPEATGMAVKVLRIYAFLSIFFYPSAFTLPNVLRAGGDSKYTMMVSMFSMWCFRVLLCWLLVTKYHWGLIGIWSGMFADWIFRSIFFWLRFHNGKWMLNQVI